MAFVPNTEAERKEMFDSIGIEKFDDLLGNIPKELLFKGELKLPDPLSEMEVLSHLSEIAAENHNSQQNLCFLGGGAYDHYIPAAVKHIISRSEFYTAYTPYQPEVSQGTLQAIYEYQTMICELTGMDASNASMYDGGSAMAEAVLLACGHTRRKSVCVSETVNPNYRKIIQTYCAGREIDVKIIPAKNGITDVDALKGAVNEETAAVLVQHPNYFGQLEDVEKMGEIANESGALYISSNDPISLALLAPPASYGVDIYTGEGQGLGNPMNFGGPYLGIFAVKQNLIRKMPGRIVGTTEDLNGTPGFVLTLQTREQHIRRENATSNICTNQGLCMLSACVYMALMGKEGLAQVAELSLQKAHYLAEELGKIDGVSLKFNNPFFKEFVLTTDLDSDIFIEKMSNKGIFAGIPLSKYYSNMEKDVLVTVTEKRTKKELDKYIESVRELFS